MAFMQLQVTFFRPHELDEMFEGDPDFDREYWTSRGDVWAARYSAPGYMDCTDWALSHKGPIDAAEAAFSMFGDDTDEEQCAELAQIIEQAKTAGHTS